MGRNSGAEAFVSTLFVLFKNVTTAVNFVEEWEVITERSLKKEKLRLVETQTFLENEEKLFLEGHWLLAIIIISLQLGEADNTPIVSSV